MRMKEASEGLAAALSPTDIADVERELKKLDEEYSRDYDDNVLYDLWYARDYKGVLDYAATLPTSDSCANSKNPLHASNTTTMPMSHASALIGAAGTHRV